MSAFYADLHIHSKHSRATSKDCNLTELACWARRKGIAVVGTGDFTHPAWLNEIKENLVPAEPGLYRLRPDLETEIEQRLTSSRHRPSKLYDPGPTRFMLQVEISTIYKKGDRTRKVHHVIYAPGIEQAERIGKSLARIGNIGSDGRPILGLDSRDLLEITLESDPGSYLVPAHIWTPWFSALGSKSGFDSIDECYADLASHIFAVETGLSSDPPMNWRLSSLDRFRLVSNSDAHSPSKLGREACVFNTPMDYFAMRKALETGTGYDGTVEFFPEEGKYHVDGHRKCGVRLSPDETRRKKGLCPVCGKPVTIGVMHRVAELADRGDGSRPAGAAGFRSLIPLPEVLSEIIGVGPKSKKVAQTYRALISELGPELFILEHASLADIERVSSSIFVEAISRMRKGRVICEAGFDGEYGTIHLFKKDELAGDTKSVFLFDMPPLERKEAGPVKKPIASTAKSAEPGKAKQPVRAKKSRQVFPETGLFSSLERLDPEQRRAAEIVSGPLLVTAGPGTGKTRTLTHRIAHLVGERGVQPEQCLAITFTRRAASEMTERLKNLLPGSAARVPVMTFHSLGYSMVREHAERLGLPAPFRIADDMERRQVVMDILSVSEAKAGQLLSQISALKREGAADKHTDDQSYSMLLYERELRKRRMIDFDDMIRMPVDLLEKNRDLSGLYRERYRWISVDEYQDMDEDQYRLIKLLVPEHGNICAIGDPDQAIYGFRGAKVGFFQKFCDDFKDARTVQLTGNYRSTGMIVKASKQVIAPSSLADKSSLAARMPDMARVTIHEAVTDKAEAEFVVHSVERLIGGSTFFSMDSGRVDSDDGAEAFSFSDFAVLYRTAGQAEALAEAFARSGMPCQRRSHNRLLESPEVRLIAQTMLSAPADKDVVARFEQAVELAKRKQSDADIPVAVLRSVAETSADTEDFLSRLAVGLDVDLWDPRADRVSLLTLHASKGLEFTVVFIIGCDDGLLPLRWGKSDDTDIAEERRLFFVGMTRAKERLFLCRAQKRLWQGKVRKMRASPFLRDIKDDLLERSKTEERRKKAKSVHEQLALFGA
jgi:DNA helicase-2/ATP-dependent DNA helicase PcrA